MGKMIRLDAPAPRFTTEPVPRVKRLALDFVKVTCPTCGKFVCKATPGSTVQVLCNRCKTESVTAVAA